MLKDLHICRKPEVGRGRWQGSVGYPANPGRWRGRTCAALPQSNRGRGLSGQSAGAGSLQAEGGNRLIIDYAAQSDAATIVNLTHHGYFNLGYAEDMLNHQLMVRASAITALDATAIPTGEIRQVAATCPDFRRPTLIGAVLARASEDPRLGGLDHNFVLDRPVGGICPGGEPVRP